MKLVTVTLTGVDATVNPWDLVTLYERFPFVEFGVLFSKTRQGLEKRYPGKDWIVQLGNIARFFREERKKSFPLSAHLCGSYAREVVTTRQGLVESPCEWAEDFKYKCRFERVQLNMTDEIFKLVFLEDIADTLSNRQVILQCHHGFDYLNIGKSVAGWGSDTAPTKRPFAVLFDVSGGTGMLPKGWAESDERIFCGYAGGLKPENLEEELKKIEAVAGNANVWIDMESGVRDSDDYFSMEKAVKVLEIAAPWVANGG